MYYKEYMLVDKSYGNEIGFKKLQYSVEACEKMAEDYKLTNYSIMEREVSPWKLCKNWKKN